jgi:hypothetical protein
MRLGVPSLAVLLCSSSALAAEAPDVRLPEHAAAPMTITDPVSGVGVGVRLRAVAAVPAVRDEHGARFDDVDGRSTDWRWRKSARGAEDFVTLVDPRLDTVEYEIDLWHVGGVRLYANVVELLDSRGTPRLRAAPPFVVDAQGAWREARWEVSGCEVDRDGRDPSLRWVLPPGSPSCVLRLTFDAVGLARPVVVDPAWQLTVGTMAISRWGHVAGRVGSGADARVLIAGGFGGTMLHPQETVELFDPKTQTFAMGPSMHWRRGNHEALVIDEDTVLVAGGVGALAGSMDLDDPLAAAEYYEAASGSWTEITPLPESLVLTAGDVAGGVALVAGGEGPAGTSDHVYALRIDELDGGMWTQPTLLQFPRARHAVVGLPEGTFAVIGGDRDGDAVGMVEVIDVDDGSVGAVACSPRTTLAAARTATGQVVIAGGYDSGGQPLGTTEVFDSHLPTECPAAGELTPARGEHTLTLVADRLVAVGGSDSAVPAVDESLVEVAILDDRSWTDAPAMNHARAGHTATDLGDGRLLVVGGVAFASARDDAEILGICRDDHTASDENGEPLDCFPYACSDNVCLQTCTSVHDCAAPTLCSPNGACTPPETGPIEVGSGCGCRFASGRASPFAWLVALFVAVIRCRSARRR